VQRTDALTRGLKLILEHHDAPAHILRQMDESVHSYLDNSVLEEVWLKRCKHLLTYPLAKYLKNEAPPSPDMSFRPSGKLRAWLKPRFNGFNEENTHLWYSWYQAKRSTLPVSQQLVDQAYNKHFETLTSPDPGDERVVDEIFADPTFKGVLREIRKEFTRRFNEFGSFTDLSPKTSATFVKTRGYGGQVQDLRTQVGLLTPRESYIGENGMLSAFRDSWDESVKTDHFESSLIKKSKITEEQMIMNTYAQIVIPSEMELCTMLYRPYVYSRYGKLYNFCGSQYCAYGRNEWKTLEAYTSYSTSLPSVLRCTIQAVLEPNKIRIISKGEALPYYSCKPIQKALHSTLREMPCFRLIGRPLRISDIEDLTVMSTFDMKWFSIDYSAATDGLSWLYSGRIFRYLIEDLPEMNREIANLVLGPHELYYPKEEKSRGIQTNGQLMGSILSFPILCLANLGVYLLSTSQEQKFWTDDQRLNHVLINGDDMVYASNEENWKRHVDIGKKVGLEMSIGKAYVHREYLNINSTSIHCPLHKKVLTPSIKEIGYLNVGLFYGQHKVQGERDNEREGFAKAHGADHGEYPEGIVVNINEMLRGCRPQKKIDFLKKILTTHSETIATECSSKTTECVKEKNKTFSRNLFIPESLGGMGVIAPSGFKFRITKEEVYVAQGHIDSLPGCGYTSQHPLPGYPLEERFDQDLVVPWSCQKLPNSNKDYISESKPKALLPIRRIYYKSTRDLCKKGILWYVPYRGCITV
jgi:hypothetical protein